MCFSIGTVFDTSFVCTVSWLRRVFVAFHYYRTSILFHFGLSLSLSSSVVSPDKQRRRKPKNETKQRRGQVSFLAGSDS